MDTLQRDTYEERLLSVLLDEHPGSLQVIAPVESGNPRRPRSGLALAAAAVVALLAGIVLVPTGNGTSTAAATPLPLELPTASPASPVLNELAAVARATGGPATAGHWYRHTSEWHLDTAVSGGESTSSVTPKVVETWVDRAQRRTVTRSGVAMDPSDTSPEAEAAAVAALPSGPGVEETLSAGDAPTPAPVESSEAFRAALLDAHPDRDVDAVLWQGITDRFRESHTTPAESAELLGVLAGIDGVEDRGLVRDRAGRTAQAIAFQSDYSGLDTRYVLLFDPDAGSFLGHEAVLVGDPGMLNVATPAVISYFLVIESSSRLHR